MCGKHWSNKNEYAETRRYEDATVRLDQSAEQETERCHAANFPWWTLWMIWPLMWALHTFGPWLAESGGVLLALALMVAGVVLLLRSQQEVES